MTTQRSHKGKSGPKAKSKPEAAPASPGPLRVGRLPYLNVAPFFFDGGPKTEVSLSPRALGREAAEGRLDAGLFSLVDAWTLEKEFEPVGPYGLAVRGPAKSVLLFSKDPMEKLDGAAVGVTDQTVTSVKLLSVILELRDGVRASLREGFSNDDRARLIIGDDALSPPADLKADFPLTFDLGREWYFWRERPFIFAKWMVRRSAPEEAKRLLAAELELSLKRFEKNIDLASRSLAARVPFDAVRIRDYLAGIVYRMGPGEREAEGLFRNLLGGLYPEK